MQKSICDRFWAFVSPEPSMVLFGQNLDIVCWIWTGGKEAAGYGRFALTHDKSRRAHRYIYRLLVGPIPADLELDHLCRNPSCVNPAHLEAVTFETNQLRGINTGLIRARQNAAKTHCSKDHPFDVDNTYIHSRGWRMCKTCLRDRNRKYYALKKASLS